MVPSAGAETGGEPIGIARLIARPPRCLPSKPRASRVAQQAPGRLRATSPALAQRHGRSHRQPGWKSGRGVYVCLSRTNCISNLLVTIRQLRRRRRGRGNQLTPTCTHSIPFCLPGGKPENPAACAGCVVGVTACSTLPPQGVTPVSPLRRRALQGKWYEIARLDHSFRARAHQCQRDLPPAKPTAASEVINRGYDAEEGKWREAVGRAVFTEAPTGDR